MRDERDAILLKSGEYRSECQYFISTQPSHNVKIGALFSRVPQEWFHSDYWILRGSNIRIFSISETKKTWANNLNIPI